MAKSVSTGTSAAADTPAFNFSHLVPLLHSTAHKLKAYSDPKHGLSVRPEDYSSYMRCMDNVENAAAFMQETEAGISLLLGMIENARVETFLCEALRGLLGPIATQLEHHAQTLSATITRTTTIED